jgi:hypothetical protein
LQQGEGDLGPDPGLMRLNGRCQLKLVKALDEVAVAARGQAGVDMDRDDLRRRRLAG